MRDELTRASPDESEAAWQAFLELLLEVMESCLMEGLWIPGRGLRSGTRELNSPQECDKTEA